MGTALRPRAPPRSRSPRRPPLLRELAADDRELERVRVPFRVQLAVAPEAEERLRELLRPQRGPRLEDGPDRFRSDREEPVRRVRRHDLDVTGLEAALTTGDDDPELPLQHLVALLLARVQMLLRAEAARREDDLVLERLAVRLGRGFAEDEPLARPRVLEHLPRPR